MRDRKLFLFCGKGGVGKTTISAAFALLLSSRGRRTLLVSTDPAHSLSDLFARSVGNRITEVGEKLYALELDPSEELRTYVENALSAVREVVSPEAFREMESFMRSVGSAPGAEETALVDALSRTLPGCLADFEHVVLDTAPTGHTLRLIRNALRAGEWLEELISRRERIRRLRSAGEGREREDRVLDLLRDRGRRLRELLDLLTSADTLFVPVLVPEKLPLHETVRLVEELSALSLEVSMVVVNRVLPDGTDGEFLRERKRQESVYLRRIAESFARYRVVTVRLRTRDVSTTEDLKELAQELGRQIPW